MSDTEFESKIDKIIIKLPPIKSEAECCQVAKRLQSQDLDLENLPALRVYICEDYCGMPNTCFSFFLMNHGYCDGVSYIGTWNALSLNGKDNLMSVGNSPNFG